MEPLAEQKQDDSIQDDLSHDIGQFIDSYTIQSIRHFVGSMDARDMFVFYRDHSSHLSDTLNLVIENIDRAMNTFMQRHFNLIRDYLFKIVYDFSRDSLSYFTDRFRLGRLLHFLKQFYNVKRLQELKKWFDADIEQLVDYYLDIVPTVETLLYNRALVVEYRLQHHPQYTTHQHRRILEMIQILYKQIPPSEFVEYKKELEKERSNLLLRKSSRRISPYMSTRIAAEIQQLESGIRVLEEWLTPHQNFARTQMIRLATDTSRDLEPGVASMVEEMQGVRPVRYLGLSQQRQRAQIARQHRQSSPNVMDMSDQRELDELLNHFVPRRRKSL
jgi:hypothetical protein